MKDNVFKLTKERSRRYHTHTIMDAGIALLANTPAQAETLLHSLERAAAGISFHVNIHKTEYMCFIQRGNISTLSGSSLKRVDKLTYLRNSVSSTKTDISTQLALVSLGYQSYRSQTRPIKWNVVFSKQRSYPYCCTTWRLTNRTEKKIDCNYTRMLRAISNKSWRQYPTKR